MNVTDLMQSFFGGDSAAKLGQAAGLDVQAAQKALGVGLPMQLDALADHAGSAQGQSQIMEAIQNLPKFGSVAEALGGADGASNLQRAGELLGPALLGGKADSIVNAITSQLGGGAAGGASRLMNMALPLVLSVLGKGGLDAGNIGSMLGGMKGSLGGLGSLLGAGAAAGVASAASGALGSVTNAVSGGLPSVGGVAGGALTSAGLLDMLKGQFSGAVAEKIGSVAGFGGSTAGRATQAALPVLLGALANKGKTEAGAASLLDMAKQFSGLGLTDASGNLNANFLNNAADVAKVQGQAGGLLGSLFGNLDEVVGKFGSALGGSGASSRNLLALMAPLILSLLSGKGLSAGALSGLLGGLLPNLSGLLPAGLGSLGALLGGTAAAAPAVTTPSVTTPSVTHAATPPRPTATAPTAPAVTNAVTTEKRGGFPWWLIPLVLLLGLGGCWLLNQNKGTTTTSTTNNTATTTPSGTFAITNPTADAQLPAGGFDLTGTGKPGDEVEVFEDGTSLGKVKVGDDGTWKQTVPSPSAGDHTYSVKGPDGAELGNVKATIAAPDANASAANCTKDYTLSISDGQTVSEPFKFGGMGQGKGYSVTVKRGDRTIGTKDIPLDATCGWAYMSKPGAGNVTYEVRPMGDAAAAALSTVSLTVNKQ